MGNTSLPPDENTIIAAVCRKLSAAGYIIEQSLTTTEHGVDVVARHTQTGIRVLVEAKGGTSSRKGSNRYGKPYTQSQIFDRVAKGIFTCLQLRTDHPDRSSVRVILALPDTPDHFKKYVSTVSSSLDVTGIEIWFLNGSS